MAGMRKRRLRDRATGPTTLIASGCTVTGEFAGSNDLLVSGTVVGNSRLDGVVTITAEGRWQGSLDARDLVISGTVEGDVSADGHIELASSARIRGTVTGDRIAVAEGAVIEGDMRITGQGGGATPFSERRNTAAAPAATAKKAS